MCLRVDISMKNKRVSEVNNAQLYYWYAYYWTDGFFGQ